MTDDHKNNSFDIFPTIKTDFIQQEKMTHSQISRTCVVTCIDQ